MNALSRIMIKSFIAIAGSVYVGFILQTGVFPRIALAGVTPNLLVVITSMFGFRLGAKYGMAAGFLAGLVLDTYSGAFFGMYALIFTYIGFLNGAAARLYFGDDIKLPLFLVGGSDFLYGMIVYSSMFLLRGEREPGFYVMNIVMPETVYTTVVAIFMYYPVTKLCQWVDKNDERPKSREIV